MRLREAVRGSAKALAGKDAETIALKFLAGKSLPLWAVTKGKTPGCESKFGVYPGVMSDLSANGWATENLRVE
jgi:hypothetical protein